MKFVVVVCSLVLLGTACPFHAGAFETNRAVRSTSLTQGSKHSANGLPKGLTSIPLDHLSSGALRLLDRDGNLVQPPGKASSVLEAAADPAISAGLDPRVGANIRLGDDPAQLPSNLRAQAEPHIARHPNAPDTLAATFQEGRYTDGGAADCGYAISHDGGLTWSRALIPGLTPVVGGPYLRATDPVAGFDLNGTIYLNTLVLLDATLTASAVVISRSTNGGASFDPPIEAIRSPTSSVMLDKNWMAINTFAGTPTAGRIVLTYTRFGGGVYPIACTISDNGGKTWSAETYVTPASYFAQGSQPLFLPDGKLAVVYWNLSSDRVEMVLSTNGGNTFDSPRQITTVTRYDAPNIRDGNFLPSAAADRTAGRLFVAYQGYYGGQPSILFTKSADAGTTWSTPQRISDNPLNTPVCNATIAASPDGQVVTVVFYDGRLNGGNGYLFDLFLAQSFDSGLTWEPNIRVSSVSSDVRLAPLTGSGYMVGDYLGVAPSTGVDVPSVPIWVDTRTGNPDPFIARVGMSRQITFPGWRAARFSLGQIQTPAIGGTSADPDGDGIPNILEYFFALDPRTSDRPFFSESFSGTGQSATFSTSFERLSGTSDVTYSWSGSTNLSHWDAATPSTVLITTNITRKTEIVTSRFSPATNAHQFYRPDVQN
jgi:hypothetical protein